MFFYPVTTSFVERLSETVKNEIAKQVAEKVYEEMRSGKYLEDAYIFKVAESIASSEFQLELLRHPDSDSFTIRTSEKIK